MRLIETLQFVADTVVEALGFEVAVVSLVDADVSSMVVAAVAGPEAVRELLLHRRQAADGWGQLVSASTPLGRLRFLDHAMPVGDPADGLGWIPGTVLSDDPSAWQPEAALFAPLEGPDGRPLGILSVDVPRSALPPDVATRHALETFAVTVSLAIQHAQLTAASHEAAARFQSVFDGSPIPVGLLGPDTRFVQVNAAFGAFLGRSPADLVGRSPREFTHPDDRVASDVLADAVRRRAGGDAVLPLEKRYLLPDGSVVWGRLHLAVLGSADDSQFVVAQLEDITERKRTEARLVNQANYDALTGLPNRAYAMHLLRTAMEEDTAAGGMTVAFVCDVDKLRMVNDAHGRAVGDAYVREIGRRISLAVRPGDAVGRLGGDEFLVVLPGIREPAEGIGVAGRVIDAVHRPCQVGGQTFTPSLSIGIAYGRGPSSNADVVVARADSAMYRAKTEDRGGWHVFDAAVKNTAALQLQLRSDVQRAIDEEQFVLHYQPIVRLSDGAVIAHESLLRWQHPQRGLLMPGDFLDVVLDSEYESAVTDWILHRACLDAMDRPQGMRTVTVNTSSVQVGRRDLPEVVLAALAGSGLAPSELVIELTEDRLLSRPDGPALLARLRSTGLSVALDDFGTGYAGLHYLQRLPAVNILKLDRAFVAGVGKDAVSEHIVQAAIELAHRCGLSIVIEGVETAEQAAFVRELGADSAQGWYFGRPVPAGWHFCAA